MTLIGRIGNYLAKFVGSGFIQVEDGEAKLVSFIPLKIRELYHRYVIPSPGQSAVLGAAKPAPYMVIADNDGKCYAIKGLSGEDCIVVWDFETQSFLTKATTDFPVSVKGALEKRDGIELAGFSPPSSACYDKAREVMALKGDGIVFITSKTVEYPDDACCQDDDCGCGCDSYKSVSVASVIPYPDDSTETVYILTWQFGVGFVFIVQPDPIQGPVGDTGNTGDQGAQGNKGDTGAMGDPGPQGDPGVDGLDGADAPPFDPADVVVNLTTVDMDRSSLVAASLTAAQNINAAGASINFDPTSRAEADWAHVGGAATFVIDGTDYDHVEIDANIIYEEGTPGGGIPIHPILDLYKNGTIIASATSQNGHILDDAGADTVKGSNSIRFVDTGALILGTAYHLVCRQGNNTVTALTGVAGFFTAKAVARVAAVTDVTLSPAP